MDTVERVERIRGLHATLAWEPYSDWGIGDGQRRHGYMREDGAGYVLPEDDGRWWATWAHPMKCDAPGWHHHALGTYASAEAAAMAFDKVYDLERIAGNVDRMTRDDAAALSLARSNGWQDIATAPKGTFLGYDPKWGVCEIMRSDQMDYWALGTFNGQYIRANPTHWQPLPEPPLDRLGGSEK